MQAGPRGTGGQGQRGQAMVLFLVLAGILCLGAILMFNTGQAVNKKVRLTNTADAAAYSVAVQQARAMNFAAYMNRGRVANEVAIAQMVSLWSWLNMYHTHTVAGYNLMTYLSLVPYVNIVARPLAQVYKVAEQIMAKARTVYRPIASQVISGNGGALPLSLDDWNLVLAEAADAMLTIGAGVDGYMIARDVVQKNDPTAEIAPAGVLLLGNQLRKAATTSGLLERHKANRRNPGMDRFRNVVMASRDRFSADRNDSFGPDLGIVEIKFRERGGTDMVEYNRWSAVDTLDFSVKVDLFVFEFDLNVPLGFGGAQAVKSGQPKFFPGIRSGGRNQRGNGWYSEYHPGNRTYAQYNGATHSTARRLAERYPSVNVPGYVPFFTPMRPSGGPNKKRDAYFTGYNGLRDYYEVKGEYAQTPEGDKAGPVFTVLVQSKRQDARTSEDINGIGGPVGGQLEMKNAMNNDQMTAIASAQTYFNRPPANALFKRMVPRSWNGDARAVNELEMGSLFSPYWQAKLVETPKADYIAAGLGSLVSG
ncbi:pilus assembly protein TadG-related protein [Marilutibacter spongiae]|uniref:Tad domain-containing protein n=1 Tax=Marilutibacter spongiae TaxID=2025720 RepID=A0A7W3TPI7_9GAMM|nr:pilus assembly protein TadG-related protein [Lysobacter spongiae]MBB1061986.1 Tad domain-containing protein [Lysobacter spongiae]